jgi:hypothetical protein
MRKLLLILIMSMFLLSLVSAQQGTLGTFKQNECIDLIQTCADCTFNNITSVLYPNSTQALGQVPMTQTGTQFNYSFCSTSVPGTYIINGLGNPGTINTIWVYDLVITPSGNAFNDSSATTTAIILALMFGVTVFFLIFSKTTVNPTIQLFFNLISYLTMALTVGAGVILLQSSGVQSNISSLMTGLMWLIGIVLVIIMYYIFIQQTKHALSLMRAKKGYEDDDF